MKKFFSLLGLLSLFLFSYIYSSFSVSVVNSYDDIMVYLNEIKDEYKISSVDALIVGNSITPGVSGREIDVKKSYENMRKINKFSSSLIVYKEITPEVSLKNNKDKYIVSGNKSKNRVSIILKVNDKRKLDKIKNFNFDYTIDNKKTEINNFCIYSNLEYLNYCASNNMYTIKPIEISNYPLKKTKEVIKNGSILIYNVNNEFINEYELILNYIKSKGFIVVDISKLISE